MQVFFDSHVHSQYSDDSEQTFAEIYRAAVEKGLCGLTVTDHANLSIIEEDSTFECIAASAKEAKNTNKRFGNEVQVFCGVEVSEHFDDPDNTQKILNLADYDAVIGSVHRLEFGRWKDFYSKISFDESFPLEELYGYMDKYFKYLLRVAEQADYDILAHLTCPLRYINGKYHRGLRLEPYREVIDEILHCLLQRNKALEVNTSGIRGIYDNLMPDLWIIQRYFDMGGRLITLGSDAHTPDRVGNAFEETATMLSQIGFPGYYHYEHRQPQFTMFAGMAPVAERT